MTRNPDTADDLVQDTLVRALQKGWQLQPEGHLRPWLLRVLRNLHIDGCRRTARRGTTVEPSPELLSCAPRQEQQLFLREVTAAMKGTSAAELLVASALQLSYEEMAAQARVPVGTIRSRLSRARVQLQQMIEGKGPGLPGEPTAPAKV